MPIEALIFDFDGVVLDTETPDFETWRAVFQLHGAVLELSWWSQFIGGSTSNVDIIGELERITGRTMDRHQVWETRRQRYLEIVSASPMLPGVVDYISEAKRMGLKLGVASSSNRSWVEGHLTERGIIRHFESISTSEDVTHVKPEPDLYLLAASKLEVSPKNSLAIEDSAKGVTAAKTAGMFCVAVPNAATQHLSLGHADMQLDALSDMPLESLLHAIRT